MKLKTFNISEYQRPCTTKTTKKKTCQQQETLENLDLNWVNYV